MSDPKEEAVAEVEEIDPTPADIEQFLPESTDLVVHDPRDDQELAWVLDRHDVEQILMEVQRRALKVWVYDLPGERGKRRRELSYKGARDIVQLMNRTGRVKIGMLPETLKLERFREDVGNGGPEPMVRAIIFARDEVTGQTMPGVSTEPLYLKLTKATAKRKREEGKDIPADDRVFDPFAETKAANKATRNALRAFIPEEAAQTVLAMFTGESERVQRIMTAQQQQTEDLPAALTDNEAKALIAQAEALYVEMCGLDSRVRVEFPPGHFNAYLFRSHHDHDALRRFVGYLEEKRDGFASKYGGAS